MRIGILGATGPAGSGLAARLASVGFDVCVGSRSKYRAMEVADDLAERWSDRGLAIDAADNAGAADADVVVIATPWDAAASTAASVARQLEGKVVISMANALARVSAPTTRRRPPRPSTSSGAFPTYGRSTPASCPMPPPSKPSLPCCSS